MSLGPNVSPSSWVTTSRFPKDEPCLGSRHTRRRVPTHPARRASRLPLRGEVAVRRLFRVPSEDSRASFRCLRSIALSLLVINRGDSVARCDEEHVYRERFHESALWTESRIDCDRAGDVDRGGERLCALAWLQKNRIGGGERRRLLCRVRPVESCGQVSARRSRCPRCALDFPFVLLPR